LDFWANQYREAWPASVLADGLTVGCTTYTAEELEAILLTTPGEGDCVTALQHQVIIARLNIANGASEEYANLTAESLAGADAVLCGGEGDCNSLVDTLNAVRAQFECPVQE
jgi:hypothetical protein